MDSFIIVLPGGALKEVGWAILDCLGVCAYLQAIGFGTNSFWLSDGTRSLQSGGIPSLPAGYRLAVVPRVRGGMEGTAGGDGGSSALVEPRVPFAKYMEGDTHAQWQQAVDAQELLQKKIDVQTRIDALGEKKGQWLNGFVMHHGVDVRSTGQVVELIVCYMLFEKCDLDVATGRFISSMTSAHLNTSPGFQALMAKLEA